MFSTGPHPRFPGGRRLTLALGLASVLASCAGTTLTNMWKDPGYSGPKLTNVLVIGLAKEETARRLWEETFSAEVGRQGAKATPLFTLYSSAWPDTSVLRQKVEEMGFDGVVVTRVIGVKQQTTYTPGYVSYTPGYYGRPYWGYYGAAVVTPGYATTDEYLRVETRVFATAGSARLIWTGTTETMNPSSATEVSREISGVLIPELRRQGIL